MPVLLFLFAAAFASSQFGSAIRRLPSLAEPHSTVLNAKVQPAAQVTLVSEYSARVASIHLSVGTEVDAGRVLVTLENGEISSQVDSAEKRVEIASTRLRDARSRANLEHSSVDAEKSNSAERGRQAAQERLEGFSLDPFQSRLSSARARVDQLNQLAGQGLVRAEELESARNARESAQRELASAREHLSRLQQELGDAESQVRVTVASRGNGTAEIAAAEVDLQEARSVLDVAQQRAARLKILTPVHGSVVDLPVHEGDTVLAGGVVARVADLSSLAVSVPVAAAVARTVLSGDPVQVRIPADPGYASSGRVDSVTLGSEQGTPAYSIRVVMPNPGHRLDFVGLDAELEFHHRKSL